MPGAAASFLVRDQMVHPMFVLHEHAEMAGELGQFLPNGPFVLKQGVNRVLARMPLAPDRQADEQARIGEATRPRQPGRRIVSRRPIRPTRADWAPRNNSSP